MKPKVIIFWCSIIIATLVLWLRGEAWVLDGEGQGYRWPDYIYNAWMIDLKESRLYDPFRNPLHGFCVGQLGSVVGGYINAAIVISSLSIWLVMFSCAQMVRIWVGEWSGITVALLISFSLPLADASQWSNLYPMLAGGIALCLWSVSRLWIHNKGFVFAGFAGGLALAIDPRALPFALLVSLSLLWCGARTFRWGQLFVGLLFLLYGYSLQDGFGMAEHHHLDTLEYIEAQKKVVIGRINSHNNPMLTEKCANVSSSLVFSLELLKTPCGQEMLFENLDVGIPRQLTLPLWFVGVFSVLFLVAPGRDWLGRVLISGCIVGTASISFLTMAIEERYMLLNTGPMIALAVLGFFWSVSKCTPIRFFAPIFSIGLIFWGGALDQKRQEIGARPGTRDSANNNMWNKSARYVRKNLPSDALFLDCGAQSINLSLLPEKRIHDTPPSLYTHLMTEGVARYCVRWLTNPPQGDVFFGIGPQHWQDSSGTSQIHYEAVKKALKKSRSWKSAGSTPSYSLYRYTP